eukprot:TRINITY_DN1317_c0_g1_i5.p1 TRINITY_DN1317_c0_g1~~TRINITY_DN1317_c0_g1_i5.p1  ORF type:complete len:896 (+),score=164.13 TRINITY_DN1317_c0_g1_i5:123-2810(+)
MALTRIAIIGALFHIFCTICMFDIYFRSPVVHGMTPFAATVKPPAKRVVFIVADGLRADKLFERKDETPFLRNVVEKTGVWGISHTRVPTESRPGHVALISGFYEDVSSVTTGWKENPVEFDSVFNQSRYTWGWGSPDILPMFSRHHEDHVFMHTYDSEDEDFAADGAKLDTWVFDKVSDFFSTDAIKNKTVNKMLKQDKVVFFLHLLGIDTTGHSKRPYSSDYINNILLVDKGINKMVEIFENFYRDNATAFVFTSDHGMSDKGSHGGGEWENTETPLIAWGAGIRKPQSSDNAQQHHNRKTWAVDHHKELSTTTSNPAAVPTTNSATSSLFYTPRSWSLNHIRRVDIEQADVAPLMSSLIGIPFPLNSVGVLPVEYLSTDNYWKAQNLVANAKQIFAQVERKAQMKQSTTFFFREFHLLTVEMGYQAFNEIQWSLSRDQYNYVYSRAKEVIVLCLEAFHYYQTYDRAFLLSVTIASYVGWLLYVFINLINNFTNHKFKSEQFIYSNQVKILCGLFLMLSFIFLYSEHAPIQYYAYFIFPTYFWGFTMINIPTIMWLWNKYFSMNPEDKSQTLVVIIISFLLLEVQVAGFYFRELFSLCIAIVGIWAYRNKKLQQSLFKSSSSTSSSYNIGTIWSIMIGIEAIFPLLPISSGKFTPLVWLGGILMALFGILSQTSQIRSLFVDNTTTTSTTTTTTTIEYQRTKPTNTLKFRLTIQILLILLSSWLVYSTELSLTEYNTGLPRINALLSWSIVVYSILAVVSIPKNVVYYDAVIYIILSLASPFILLSISYEVLFYCSMSLTLMFWMIVEKKIKYQHHYPNYRHGGSSSGSGGGGGGGDGEVYSSSSVNINLEGHVKHEAESTIDLDNCRIANFTVSKTNQLTNLLTNQSINQSS